MDNIALLKCQSAFPSSTGVGWPWLWTPSAAACPPPNACPKISIVTPSFNQGQFIEETIRSVLLQNYPNLEYIVVDGGSTDNTIEIIKKYERWITYWVSERDRGQSHAINKGFARSSGEVVSWLCSDDILAPNALFIVARHLANKSRSLLVGESMISKDPGTLQGQKDSRKPTFEAMAYDARSFPQPSVFWTTDLFKVTGPLREMLNGEELYYAMDYDLWLRMHPNAENIFYCNDLISVARLHPGQKGNQAELRGKSWHFSQQRAAIALKAAFERGESNYWWLIRSYSRRFKLACQTRSLSLLRPSAFQLAALRLAINRK